MTELALDALATFRLQRLLGVDKITEPAREALLSGLWSLSPRSGRWVTTLADCAWCRSVWAAGGVLALRQLPGGRVARDLLALSAVASLVAVHLDLEDR